VARLKDRDYSYFTTVRGMCRTCRRIVPARVFFREGKVWQESLCETCGPDGIGTALIAADVDWYLREVLKEMPDRSPLPFSRAPVQGCPRDCGPCTWHASPCQLPVLSITNACNLNCPICFTYNRPDRVWHMPVDEMRRTVEWIVESSGPVDLINITGGEPTLHPGLMEILECCASPGIGRITMNSNGLRLAQDYDLCRRLADLGVCVILSFNTFDPEVSRRIHGRDVVAVKLKAIDNLTRAGARMTILFVCIRDVNEDAIARLFDLMRQNDQVLSLTVQTMTYTGQGGGRFGPRAHLPVDEAARIVCERSGGALRPADFMPRPSAHPLCYSVCYMLKSGGTFLPFLRFAQRERIAPMLTDSYLLRPASQDGFFREAIDSLYARGENAHLAVFRRLVDELYPPGGALSDFDRQRKAESAVRTVYVHAHMDEDNFDCSRAMLCPDLVPVEPGRLVPACTYNLFYRMKDERFYATASRSREKGTGTRGGD
jgi:hypothetical protein